jgi:hypothetical protein
MGQQLQGQQAQSGIMGAMGGQMQGNPLQAAMGGLVHAGGQPPESPLQNMMGQMQARQQQGMQLPQGDQMRQDLLAQMMHAREAEQLSDPMAAIAQRYRGIGQSLNAQPFNQGAGMMERLQGGARKKVSAGAKRMQAVNSASTQARMLAQIMSKRLRGS